MCRSVSSTTLPTSATERAFLVDVMVSIDRYGKWPDLSCRLMDD
jgi:hypothetical protein